MVGFMETPSGAAAAAALSRIMLKYRPIAPKPVAGGAPAATSEKTGGGGRRRKAAGRTGRRSRKSTRVVLHPEQQQQHAVKTLALMPETPERKEAGPTPAPSPSPTSSSGALTSARGRDVAPPAASWVTVESVTDTWREEEVGIGCSDETVAKGLEGDSSPCFVSDGWGRVTWTNAAYRRMVAPEEGAVALVTRGMVLPGEGTCRAFTCRVSVRYGRRGRVTLAAPCDVWCMSGGALAWRLDLKAALGLSLAT